MEKIVRLTEHDLQRIVKRVISEKDNKINEDLTDDVWNAGKQALDTAGKAADKVIAAGDKYLALKSDWWYLTPLAGVKLTYDQTRALRALQTQTFEQNMEGIREVAGGVKGVTIAVALDFTGAGEIINPIFWSLFAVYDCWLWVEKNMLNLLNIIMDVIGAATAGAGTGIVKGATASLKSVARSEVKTFVSVMAKKAPKLFQYLSKLLKGSSGIISKVVSQATKGIAVLSKKLPFMAKGFASMKKGIGTFKGFMTQLEEVFSKELVHFGQHVGQHVTQHKVAHEVVGAAVGHGGGHGEGGGHNEKGSTGVAKNSTPIPRYITVNGVKKPNPKFKQKYGYA
jgi:hypothetical protein